jgi:hypothetical protein
MSWNSAPVVIDWFVPSCAYKSLAGEWHATLHSMLSRVLCACASMFVISIEWHNCSPNRFHVLFNKKNTRPESPVGFRLLQGRLNECSISTVQGLPNRSKHPLGFCLIGICSCNNITAVLLISPAAPWGGIAREWAHRPRKGQKENERDICA